MNTLANQPPAWLAHEPSVPPKRYGRLRPPPRAGDSNVGPQVQTHMPSRSTFITKGLLPIAWIVSLLFFSAGSLQHTSADNLPFILVPVLMAVFGLFFFKALVWDLAREALRGGARRLFVLFLIVAGFNVFAREVRVPVSDRGTVILSVPDSWDEGIGRSDPNAPPTIMLVPSRGKSFHILMSVIWPSGPGVQGLTRDAVREQVRRASDGPKARAVERELPVVEFSGPAGFGAYFSATDRSPEPDGFKYLTQGMLVMSEVQITFTVLINGEPAPVLQQVLEILKTMRREPVKRAS